MKTNANKAYQRGYADGYRRGVKSNKTKEHMQLQPMYTGYVPITYYTAVIILLALFLIFLLILGYLNERSAGYVTKYKDNCLLQMSSIYSGTDCV